MCPVTDDDVRRVALALPDTTERSTYGTPGYRVHDRLFARIHDQPGVLVVWLETVDERAELIDREPDKFFTTDHYVNHASVLVRLSAIEVDELEELLAAAWTVRAKKSR
jgi:hypothetical protein